MNRYRFIRLDWKSASGLSDELALQMKPDEIVVTVSHDTSEILVLVENTSYLLSLLD